jgi:hypothetical protein
MFLTTFYFLETEFFYNVERDIKKKHTHKDVEYGIWSTILGSQTPRNERHSNTSTFTAPSQIHSFQRY